MSTIFQLIRQALFIILLSIDGTIYTIVNSIYKIYIALATARLFNNGMFTEIANRFYAVVGVVMLFVLAYVVIQGIINPDNFAKSGGEGAGILKRIAIAVIGLAIVPGVFRIAYTGQDILLSQNVIGKIFLGFNDPSNLIEHGNISVDGEPLKFDADGDGKPDTVNKPINQNDAITTSAGTVTAISIWQAVFHPANMDSMDSLAEEASKIESDIPVGSFIKGLAELTKWACGIAVVATLVTFFIPFLATAAVCEAALISDGVSNLAGKNFNLQAAYGAASATGNFTVFTAFAGKVASGEITYRFIFSTIIGAATIYLFLSFAIDMAIRAVKLAYMQIVAPIPLMLQILPKFKDNFQKWLKIVISLFVEVFIRLTFVYVVAYLISHLWSIMSGGWIMKANLGPVESLIARLILIIGMLGFAKTAPQFVSETLGISTGNLNLGIRKKLHETGALSFAAGIGGIGANLISGFGTRARNNFRAHQSVFRALGAGTVGGLSRAIYSAPSTIRAARTVGPSFREVGARVKDSFIKGQEDEEKRDAKRDTKNANIRAEAEKILKAEGKEATEENIRKVWREASHQARNNKIKDFILNEVAPVKFNKEEVEAILKAKVAAEQLKSTLEDTAAKYNRDAKIAEHERSQLDTDTGRKRIALELAQEKLAKGEIDKDRYAEITTNDAALNSFIAENNSEYSSKLFKAKEAADKKVKNAKKAAVNEELFREQFYGEDEEKPVTEALLKFFRDHPELQEHKDKVINMNGESKTLDQHLKDMFGDNYMTEIDYDRALKGFNKIEKEYDIETVDATGNKVKGKIRTRIIGNKEKEFFIDSAGIEHELEHKKDGKGHDIKTEFFIDKDENRSFSGTKVIKQESDTKTIRTYEHTEACTDDNKKITDGTVLDMVHATTGETGQVDLVINDGTGDVQERVVVTKNAAGMIQGQVITGKIPAGQVELGATTDAIFTQTGVLGVDVPVTVEVSNAGNIPVEISVEKNSSNIITTKINGATCTLNSSGKISLGSMALEAEAEISDLVTPTVVARGPGYHTVTLGTKTIDVKVDRKGQVDCKEYVLPPMSPTEGVIQTRIIKPLQEGGFKDGAELKVSSIAETIPVGSVEYKDKGENFRITKDTSGHVAYTRQDKDGNVVRLTEEQMQEEFHNRPSVNTQALTKLIKAKRDSRVEVISKSGTTTTTETVKVSHDGKVAVLQEAGKISVNAAVSGLTDGGSVSFALPGKAGTVTAHKVGGNVTYSVTKSGETTPAAGLQNLSQAELESKLALQVDLEDIPSVVKTGEAEIDLSGVTGSPTKIKVSNKNESELVALNKGAQIKGCRSIVTAIQESGKDSSIRLGNGSTVRLESQPDPTNPTVKKYTYYYIDEDGNTSTYTDFATLERDKSIADAEVTSVTGMVLGEDKSASVGDGLEDLGKNIDRGLRESNAFEEMSRRTSRPKPTNKE